MISFLLAKQWPADDDHIGNEFTTQPWLFSTSAAWLYCRMHGGTIPVRTHLRGPRTSLCLLDDPVTFAINEDHAPKIRSSPAGVLNSFCSRPSMGYRRSFRGANMSMSLTAVC